MSEQNAAVQVAKEQANVVKDEFVVMGVNVKLASVPIGLIQDAQSRLKMPRVPILFDEEKGRELENPTHPDYLADVQEYEEQKGIVALDTMIMFGIEIDKLPDDDSWLKKLKFLHKRGTLDLSAVDFDDDIDVEFLFKKYIVASTEIITAIGKMTGVSKESIAQAKAGFRRKA